MAALLTASAGHYSHPGRKPENQDFCGLRIPQEPLLSAKGIAAALADGISSSDVSQIASQTSVTGFLEDYYSTSEAWSVRQSGQRVLTAANSWLYSQTQQSQHRFDKDRGYVCTFSALIVKSTTAHIFHVGDTRIYHLRQHRLEQLTKDHRVWVSPEKNYLSRALGIDSHLEIDYHTVQVEQGDYFILMTDGVYEHVTDQSLLAALATHPQNLDEAAKTLAEQAYEQGSTDNLTIQIIRLDSLPSPGATELYQHLTGLPFPPVPEARAKFDGYTIIRELHANHRSHVYLAVDDDTGEQVVVKIPAADLKDNPLLLERFLMEEWIARRINNVNVLKAGPQTRKRNFLYIVLEYIEGQTLKQWLLDNPKPKLDAVRGIIEQIAKGLRGFHRLEMLHQDLRPDNIMLDRTGTVKIIDFGSTRVAGLMEMNPQDESEHILGTLQYSAPEYFTGGYISARSDQFSLGVIAYQMLTGKLPYGTEAAKCKTKTQQLALRYNSLLFEHPEIPGWIDHALKKAVHPNPDLRYEDLPEFIFDFSHPNKAYLNKTRQPLIERNPVLFWKSLTLFWFVCTLVLIAKGVHTG
ncbi:MAG: protein kinase [Methylobacter sp.]|nr:MAG: protein kinase [Methylobacter sp.]